MPFNRASNKPTEAQLTQVDVIEAPKLVGYPLNVHSWGVREDDRVSKQRDGIAINRCVV